MPRQLIVQSHITKAEEIEIGVGEVQTSHWRDEYGWPQSDAIDAMGANTHYELGNRKQAGSYLSEGSTESRQLHRPNSHMYLARVHCVEQTSSCINCKRVFNTSI